MKNVDAANHFIGEAKDAINYIRDSPKLMAVFKDIQSQSSKSFTNFSPFCPTRYVIFIYDNM